MAFQCVKILSRLNNGQPWEEALTSVARRKLNYVGLNFTKDPKLDLKSSRHMWALYEYEMGKDPSQKKKVSFKPPSILLPRGK